ncbi:MAG TPA: sulfatase [Verrucomicrobiales bacterium]|nr:sulfatase [Verrucomicrobiales bacterium]
MPFSSLIRVFALAFCSVSVLSSASAQNPRPNILFAIADDWGWPHAGAYGDPIVQTPHFDRVAREGLLFHHAYVSAPSCTPSRSAILTGQWHWRLEEAANLWSTLQTKFPNYTVLLEESGYHTGKTRKGWGPGNFRPGGYSRDPAGTNYRSFRAFLDARPPDAPFCFWLGSSDPHRPYEENSGRASGIDPSRVLVPPFLPDTPIVRNDLCDYYFEVQRFDRDLGAALTLLEERGELDRTLIVVAGDHGMPFPRCKSNLYDYGVRVPLAIRWGDRFRGPRESTTFVSLTDLAPTFLSAVGLLIPDSMTGRPLLPLLKSPGADPPVVHRPFVLTGKERHVPSQERGNPGGYPMRAIRTHDFLYIRNFKPDRWPNGIADDENSFDGWAFSDCDNGPTKSEILSGKDSGAGKRSFDWCFGKRPAEELYDLRSDPDQLDNVAADPAYAAPRKELAERLMRELVLSDDPRVLGRGDRFESFPYKGIFGNSPPAR